MDNFNGITVHLNHRDITMVAVSRAEYPAIAAYKQRMGWRFPWYSSAGSDFNFDTHVSFTPEEMQAGKGEYNYQVIPVSMSELPGISVFLKDGDTIYHTYSTYTRGLDMLNVAYHYMDLVPKGRDEGPDGLNAWLRATTSTATDGPRAAARVGRPDQSVAAPRLLSRLPPLPDG